MAIIRVVAADGLRVPTEHDPHQYIEQAPVEVEDSLYYRRLIADGDLTMAVEPAAKEDKAKGAK